MELKCMKILKKIDEAANNYGTDYFKRRIISINSVVQADDGTCVFIGRSRLHGPVRDIKTKTNRLRRHAKPTHHE
jgi:hypothetical protein